MFLKNKKPITKKDIIISSILLFIFVYFYLFPFLAIKFNQIRAVNIIKSNVYYGVNSGLTINDADKAYPGNTIFTSFAGHLDKDGRVNNSILINNNGDIVKEWDILGFPAKLLPGGNILGNDRLCNYTPENIHQEACAIVELDWDGEEVWKFDKWEADSKGNLIARSHHDFQRSNSSVIFTPNLPLASTSSEKTLILSHTTVLNKDINSEPLEDDALLEVGADGIILWKWVASDHFLEYGFTEPMKKAILNSKLFKNKLLGGFHYPNATIDWLHLNSAKYLGPNIWYDNGDKRFAPDNIIISSRNGCFVAIVDKQTGKIVWQLGPDYSDGPEKEIGQIIGQHDAYIVPKGLPGEGNIILFDNGGFSCYGNFLGISTFPANFRKYSRVLEIDPVSLKIVWEYSQPESKGEQKEFFSWLMGSAQRLSNGNTLITETATGRIFEVTKDKEIVWEYYALFPNGAEANSLGSENYIYTAYRYPDEWFPRINHQK